MKNYDYTEVNEVRLPNLLLPATNYEIGIWGQRYLEYIKTHRKPYYTTLKMQCKLYKHVHEIDVNAREMYELLIMNMAAKQGITEKLKADDMIAWTQAMNNIANQAREIVYHEIIFAR